MEIFTIEDFLKYEKLFPEKCTLGEEKVEYKTKEENKETHQSVSYTHLTLPTNSRV